MVRTHKKAAAKQEPNTKLNNRIRFYFLLCHSDIEPTIGLKMITKNEFDVLLTILG
jgi:hypothetical protein